MGQRDMCNKWKKNQKNENKTIWDHWI